MCIMCHPTLKVENKLLLPMLKCSILIRAILLGAILSFKHGGDLQTLKYAMKPTKQMLQYDKNQLVIFFRELAG